MTKKTKKSQRDAFIDEVINTYDKLFNKALKTDNEELFSRMLVDFSIDDLIQSTCVHYAKDVLKKAWENSIENQKSMLASAGKLDFKTKN